MIYLTPQGYHDLNNIPQNQPVSFEVESTLTWNSAQEKSAECFFLKDYFSVALNFQLLRLLTATITMKETPVQSVNFQLSVQCGPSTPTHSIEFCHRICIMYLPSSVLKIQQNNFVSLPEEDVSVTQIVSCMSQSASSAKDIFRLGKGSR